VDPARDVVLPVYPGDIAKPNLSLPEQALVSHSAADVAVPCQPVALQRHAVVHATASDHVAIHRLLTSVFHDPSPAEFQAELDQPLYDPTDRLLVKNGSQIVSHVYAMSRMMDVESLRIPIGVVAQLVTLPEYRGRGFATSVLETAEDQLVEDGAVVSLTWTGCVDFFRHRGWTLCGRHCWSEVSPRSLLAELEVRREPPRHAFSRKRPKLTVRRWWHYERPALLRLYHERFAPRVGAFHRNDERWQWLVARRAYDRIFVAIDGPPGDVTEDATERIVGYAIVCNDRVVELVAAPDRRDALEALLRRICGDAIERDDCAVRFDAPPDDPLHALVKAAGGQHRHKWYDRGYAAMAKLLDPVRFVTQLCPALHERAKAAELPRPFELGLLIGGEKHRLVFSRRSVKLVSGKLGPDFLAMRLGPLTHMLLGCVGASELAAAGRAEVSSDRVRKLAQILFPLRPLWFPPWDDLAAP
jgi:predicted acetyltransferase